MAALMVASILAAAALPTMTSRMRDRRAQQMAQQIAMFYREGRTRAIGRGTSHLIRFSTNTDPQGGLDMLEAVQTATTGNLGQCVGLPFAGTDGCNIVNWGTATESRQVAHMGQNQGLYTEVFTEFKYNNGAQANVDVCYSPGGRSYIRTAQSGPFVAFNSVQRLDVTRKLSGNPIDALVRQVILLPNGSTRVETTVTGGAL